MNLLHRSAKRLLRTHSTSFPALREIPLPALLHRFLLEAEPAHKNIINVCTRQLSVSAEYHMHETALEDQEHGILSAVACSDVPLSHHTHTGFSDGVACKGTGPEHGTRRLSGGATVLNSVTHIDDSACTLVDDSVTKSVLASQDGLEKRSNIVTGVANTASQTNHNEGNPCKECISELVVADAGTFLDKNKNGKQFGSITLELAQTNCVPERKEGTKQFDGSAEVAIFDPCKASGKDTDLENHVDSSIHVHALETVQMTLFPSKDKQAQRVKDRASEFLILCNSKSRSQNHNAELTRKEGLKLSVNHPETDLQRADVAMPRVKDASEVCVKDTKTSCNKNALEGMCSDSCSFLKGMDVSRKVESFTKEPHKSVDSAMSQIKKIKKKKKRRKKKNNTSRQFAPENLKQLSLTPHPFHIAPAGQSSWTEKLNMHGQSSKDAIAHPESSVYVHSKDSRHREVHKLKDKEQRECVHESMSREVRKLLECQDTEHRTWRLVEKAALSQWECTRRPSHFADKEQPYLNALLHNEVIERGPSSQIHLMGKWQRVDSTMNTGKAMDYNQIMDSTSLDPPPNYWLQAGTVTPGETIECVAEKVKWDLAGVRKVHYPITNCRELYIILDLNGVLIKRWDKNPSLPGICKLNKKWIQLRPGCIEFLQKAFSSFRVGIWSTMTQKNVLSMCNFLEQEAHQSFPFFMLWSKDSCYQHMGVRRPNKGNVLADFKPLSRVWGYFKPYLGFQNTVLVDDSPYKACMNNPYNCIFPDTFEGDTDDKYLNNVLWPYLEKMKMSRDMQAYIANNPLGQLPVVAGHELYHHVQKVMDVFDCRASPVLVA